MSKFIDKLNQVLEANPQPIGFRAIQPALSKPRILLIASLAQTNVDHLADYVAGADAGLLRISELNLGIKTFQKLRQITPDVPWGVWLKNIDRKGIKRVAKTDWDFLIFPAANTPLPLLQNEEVAKILEVEASFDEGLLRTVNELPVDAVLISDEQGGDNLLTCHHLMVCQRFASLLAKPLLIPAPPSVTPDELKALWEAGVDGIIVEVDIKHPVGVIKELRQTIDKLTFPPRHKPGKRGALLPYISRESDIELEEE